MNQVTNELNFVQKYVRGLVKQDDILDHIDSWHYSEYKLPLNDYIGLSLDEYLDFVDSDANLTGILNQKKKEYNRSRFTVVK